MSILKIKKKHNQLQKSSMKIEKYSEELLLYLKKYYKGTGDIGVSEVGGDGFVINFRYNDVCPIDYIVAVIEKKGNFNDEDLIDGSI